MKQENKIKRYPTKSIFLGGKNATKCIEIGGNAPISVQSMTFSKTHDIKTTLDQIHRLAMAGCDIVRVAVPEKKDALALKEICENSPLPVVADIHFNYRYALIAAECVAAIRINPGNIGDKTRIKEVAKAASERQIPIRIGVNCGSLEKQFELKYGQSARGMIESALYNIKLLEDCDFTNIKISLKASDVDRTISAYKMLRPLVSYPFHLGLTEAGDLAESSIKSSIALGELLRAGIGDTMRVSITGELEKEIEVARNILRFCGRQNHGINYISCPTCGRLESDLVPLLAEIKAKMPKISAPLNLSIMGCAVNALGEAKSADVAIAFGKNSGLILKKGEILGKFKSSEIIEEFIKQTQIAAQEWERLNGE